MTMIDPQLVPALTSVIEPHLEQNLIEASVVKQASVTDGVADVHIVLGFPIAGTSEALIEAVVTAASEVDGVDRVNVQLRTTILSHAVQTGLTPLPGVKNIIAVASGKGGVGKSTTAVNLALALQAEGASVGIMDADIYGPSIPCMLGTNDKPEVIDQKTVKPVNAWGLQTMSIGFLIAAGQATVWRGPMVTQALQQLLNEASWDDIDYLIVDMPPGTGDVQLSLAQRVPVAGAVVVTTPQDIALLDARKGINMFDKVKVPTLGIVENMSTHICSNCGHEEAIFGSGGGRALADETEVPLLGQLPLDMRIRMEADGGAPTVVAEPDSNITAEYRQIARRVAARLSRQTKDYAAKFPKIVIENS